MNQTQMIMTWCYAMSGYTCSGSILCWISNILWDYYWHKLIRKACKKWNKETINVSSFSTSLFNIITFYKTEWKIHITMMKYSKKNKQSQTT